MAGVLAESVECGLDGLLVFGAAGGAAVLADGCGDQVERLAGGHSPEDVVGARARGGGGDGGDDVGGHLGDQSAYFDLREACGFPFSVWMISRARHCDRLKNWYERRDLNPYALRHWNLNPARLPIPPLSH